MNKKRAHDRFADLGLYQITNKRYIIMKTISRPKSPQKSPLSESCVSPCHSKAYRIYHPIIEQTPQEQVNNTGQQNRKIEENINFASFQKKIRKSASPLSVIIANTSTHISRHIPHQFNQLARPIYCLFNSGSVYNRVINSVVAYHCSSLRIFGRRA